MKRSVNFVEVSFNESVFADPISLGLIISMALLGGIIAAVSLKWFIWKQFNITSIYVCFYMG